MSNNKTSSLTGIVIVLFISIFMCSLSILMYCNTYNNLVEQRNTEKINVND